MHFSCEVFAEKDKQIIEEEIPIKKQAKSLGVGDSILKDIGFDIEADSLNEKIKTLLASRVLREKMGSAAKSLFIERFLLDKRIEDHLVVYNDCLSNDLS